VTKVVLGQFQGGLSRMGVRFSICHVVVSIWGKNEVQQKWNGWFVRLSKNAMGMALGQFRWGGCRRGVRFSISHLVVESMGDKVIWVVVFEGMSDGENWRESGESLRY
jgi:hypothetical protein